MHQFVKKLDMPVDQRDSELLLSLRPDLCPKCFRHKNKLNRAVMKLEECSYYVFLLCVWPALYTLYGIPFAFEYCCLSQEEYHPEEAYNDIDADLEADSSGTPTARKDSDGGNLLTSALGSAGSGLLGMMGKGITFVRAPKFYRLKQKEECKRVYSIWKKYQTIKSLKKYPQRTENKNVRRKFSEVRKKYNQKNMFQVEGGGMPAGVPGMMSITSEGGIQAGSHNLTDPRVDKASKMPITPRTSHPVKNALTDTSGIRDEIKVDVGLDQEEQSAYRATPRVGSGLARKTAKV